MKIYPLYIHTIIEMICSDPPFMPRSSEVNILLAFENMGALEVRKHYFKSPKKRHSIFGPKNLASNTAATEAQKTAVLGLYTSRTPHRLIQTLFHNNPA